MVFVSPIIDMGIYRFNIFGFSKYGIFHTRGQSRLHNCRSSILLFDRIYSVSSFLKFIDQFLIEYRARQNIFQINDQHFDRVFRHKVIIRIIITIENNLFSESLIIFDRKHFLIIFYSRHLPFYNDV